MMAAPPGNDQDQSQHVVLGEGSRMASDRIQMHPRSIGQGDRPPVCQLTKERSHPPQLCSFAALQLGTPGHALFRRMERVGARFTARQELRAPVGSVQTEPWPGWRREESRGDKRRTRLADV